MTALDEVSVPLIELLDLVPSSGVALDECALRFGRTTSDFTNRSWGESCLCGFKPACWLHEILHHTLDSLMSTKPRNDDAFDISAESDLFRLEDALWVLAPKGDRQERLRGCCYDFAFNSVFECHRPWHRPPCIEAVARFGAFSSQYEEVYDALRHEGITLIHSPAQHYLSSVLSNWYPLLADLTPRSICFDGPPEADVISSELGWPVFMKGERQTSFHRRRLSIIENAAALRAALEVYATDPVLRWQRIVCRQLVPLRPVDDVSPDRIPASFEFRSFWWYGQPVGFGPYWWQAKSYDANSEERRRALEIAGEAARRINIPFLVVDVAQTAAGEWIVIECNDGQESGYCKISPFALWNAIITAEQRRVAVGE